VVDFKSDLKVILISNVRKIVAFLPDFRLENNKLTIKLSMIINKTKKLQFSTLGEENSYFPPSELFCFLLFLV